MLKKEKEARKYLRNGKITDAIDKFNEAGHELRHAGESEKAIELLEEGVRIAKEHRKLFEGSLCERSLSEIHAELGNREQCLLHTAAFRKMSIESGSRSQEQISYHVEAWCLQQLYFNGAAENTDIERAIELTKKSRELVESSKRFFKEGEPGGPPHIRKAQLFTLEAQLQNQLGNNTKALQLLSKTDSILKANDKSIRFEMLRTKCSIAPVKERVDIALLMDDEAPEDKKAQTLCELSHQYVLANSIERGYKALAQAFIFHEKQLTASELEDTTKRLCILYRLVKYSRILRNPHREPKISLCELHEAIGDLYDKYFQTLMTKEKKEYKQFIRSNILKSYEKMLELKRNHEDALRAYQGMALVYMDLDDFVKAKSCFENRLDLLNETNASQEKILDAKVSIFSCACKLNFSNLEKSFEELKDQIVRFDTKRELFEIWANYWTDKRNEEKAKEWRSVVDSIPDVLVKNEDDETDVLFWRLTEEDILEKCREENELLKLDNLTEHQKKKTNDKGETLLHLAAMKSDNEAVVEKLCKLGCDVNARDNGGWTPLLEAVGHDQLANAHVLIRYGADVNARSSQSLILDDSQSSSDNQNYGLTPLMDACTNGFIDIAKLLIDNKAKVDLKDSKKWTAYHHLKHFIENGDANEITIKFSEYLKNLTESTLVDIPPCHLRTHKEPSMLDEFSSNEIEDDSIFGRSASRKRRNSNNIEKFESAPKRKQRSGENIGFRHSPSPTDIARANKKRPSQPTVASSTQPKRFYRQNSSLSPHTNRNSLSPRHSISPTTTIRSAPSVIEKDDDLQIIQVRRSNGRKESSPLSRTTQPVVVQRSLPPISRPQICQNESEIVVKCCFEFVSKNISEDLRPLKLPMKRTLSIAEVKSKVMSENPSIAQFIIKDVWDKEDKEKAELGDKMLLSHISEPNQREIAIVFQLSEPPAHVIYENSSANPIAEVTAQLKLLSTKRQLDLSTVFLSSKEFTEVTRSFKKCEKPQNSRIGLGFCELSSEDETNLNLLLEECSELKILNTLSKSGFSGFFEKTKNRMEKLEILGTDFQDESKIVFILNNSPNLNVLRLSGLHVFSSLTADSMIPSAIIGLNSLIKLDLSFNSSWISEETYIKMFQNLRNLEELKINETKIDCQFESDWLPNISSFSARSSILQWDSVFEWLSILEKIFFVDVRYSDIDLILPEELKNARPMVECFY